MASVLTLEQKQRIEENRRKALEKLKAKCTGQASKIISPTPSNNSPALLKVQTSTKFGQLAQNVKEPNVSVSPPKSSVQIFKQKQASREGTSKPRTWQVSCEPISGTCSLISKDRFCVDISYNQQVIDLFKTIPGRQYDGTRKNWNFPIVQYDHFKKVVTPLAPNIVIGNLPKPILQTFLPKNGEPLDKSNFKDIDLSKVNETLVKKLFPFQREGIQFGISKNGRCLIADDMGLGKTIQALGIASYYKSEWPLLIICPSSMRYQWDEEIRNNLSDVPGYSIFVMNSQKDLIENPKVIILSYDLMGKKKDYLKSLNIGVCIADESHCLKSTKTQRTKAALEILTKCKRCILLSGTPAISRPSELFPQLKALQPSLFKDMIEFGVRYCDGKQDKFGWNFTGSSHLEELKILLEDRIMIRRLKVDVLDQLPSKIRQVIVLNNSLVNADSKCMSAFAKKLNQTQIKGIEKRSTLLGYFAETGRSKIKAICDHIEKLLEQNKKFLCFAHHREVLDAVCNVLENKETYYIKIDGQVNSEERKAVCDQFQEDEKFRVAVLSIKAANIGVTLTAAQLIVFAELFWNPGELLQAEDRAHRIGQKDTVLVHYLIAKGTADDYLWPLVQSKLNVLQQVGLSEDCQITVNSTNQQVIGSQPKITSFFSEMFDDNDIDDGDLATLMDELEGVPEKKRKKHF